MAYAPANTKTATDRKSNATATATLAAPGVDRRWRIRLILASVSAGVALLTVTSGATTLMTVEVTATSPCVIPCDIQALAANDAITATLSAAGSGNNGSVALVGE